MRIGSGSVAPSANRMVTVSAVLDTNNASIDKSTTTVVVEFTKDADVYAVVASACQELGSAVHSTLLHP